MEKAQKSLISQFMKQFGPLLRQYRRQSRDPLRGGLVTQERLGEMLGDVLGDAGYSGAAVSDWERNKSKINADDRLTLTALLTVLHSCGGVTQVDEANQLLLAGNYRSLDEAELAQLFPTAMVTSAIPNQDGKPAPSATRRKQLILLGKVKRFWVEGVLAKSAQSGILLDLEKRRQDTAVSQPWLPVVGTIVAPLKTQAAFDTLVENFIATDRALLILGAPGSGKTTTLITLARDLIHLAEEDENEPIPVILNLASWAEKRTAVADWISEELTVKYQIPRAIGQQWLENDNLLLLLDGLDEVPSQQQSACVTMLNEYRQVHGLTGIVVCCRSQTYEGISQPLDLGGAIQLQPLTDSQIDDYLTGGGKALSPLRMAIEQDLRLQELAHSPLTLSVMCRLYEEDGRSPAHLINELETSSHHPHHLFAVYLQHMYERRGRFRYDPEKTSNWLSWLASQMSAHNQALFLVEKMQPAWLEQQWWRWLYLLGSRLGDSLFIGLFLWLYWLLTLQARPGFDLDWSGPVLSWLPIAPIWFDLLGSCLRTAVVGLCIAITDGVIYERRLGNGAVSDRAVWGETAVVGLISIFSATLLMYFPHQEFLAALAFGVATGVMFMLFAYYVHGHHYQGDIRTVEALGWSWLGALQGLLIGVAITAVIELFEWLLYGPVAIRQTLIIVGTAFFLLGGLSGKHVSATSRPNQGIWLSLRNSTLVAFVLGVPITILGTLLWHLSFGLIGGLLIALFSGTLYGGRNVANHFYLRLLFWLQHRLPWQYTRFLDETADRIILRKVGGGYIFIHRFLQDYFTTQAAP